MKKKQIIISIDDHCAIPFEDADLTYLKSKFSYALSHYDVEITNVEVKDVETEQLDAK